VFDRDIDMSEYTISPDNTLLVTAHSTYEGPGASLGFIELWSLPDGKFIKTLEGE